MVLLSKIRILPKLTVPREGPYLVTQVHDNGTVTIAKSIVVTDRDNIRRLAPYYEDEFLSETTTTKNYTSDDEWKTKSRV